MISDAIANGSDHAPVMRSPVASLSPGPLMDLGRTLQDHSPLGDHSHDRFPNLSPYTGYVDDFYFLQEFDIELLFTYYFLICMSIKTDFLYFSNENILNSKSF